MIRTLTQNDVVECINLMNKYSYHAHYERNEAVWIQHFIHHVVEANNNNPHYIAFGDYDEDEYLNGFIIGGTFKNYYNNGFVMDVKDCILEEEKQPLRSAIRLFNAMTDHVKKHGGIHWRADSIRDGDAGLKYAQFLNRKYNAKIHYGVRGIIGE